MDKIFRLGYYLAGRLQSVLKLKKFLYKEMLGVTKNNELFSGMVREEIDHDGRSSDKTSTPSQKF